MPATIPHPTPPLDDARITAARQALAELPRAEDNERPYFWISRLKAALEALVTAWPSGVPGGLDYGQREVLGQVLADAIDYRYLRVNSGQCHDCEASPEGLCPDYRADLSLCSSYVDLAAELGIDLEGR